MRQGNQRGFGAVEAIIIVVILAVVGFIGWRMWDSSRQNTQTNQPTAQTPAEPEVYTIQFPELGVEMDVPARIKDITQHYDGTSVFASTTTLTNADPRCAANDITPFSNLWRKEGIYHQEFGSGLLAKQFDGFYIAHGPPSSPCSLNREVQEAALEARRSFTDAFDTLRIIP